MIEKMLFQKGEAIFIFHIAYICPLIETDDPAFFKAYFPCSY